MLGTIVTLQWYKETIIDDNNNTQEQAFVSYDHNTLDHSSF